MMDTFPVLPWEMCVLYAEYRTETRNLHLTLIENDIHRYTFSTWIIFKN